MRGADFILSAKDNQATLAQAVQTLFDRSVCDVECGLLQQDITLDKGHARLETRRCVVAHDVSTLPEAIRQDWHIENQCHWVLDVVFGEDDRRLHVGHGAQNFAILRRIVLNLIKQDKVTKASTRRKWNRLNWSADYLQRLFGLVPL